MKVSAIIPAYNEGPRIKDVLIPLLNSKLIYEVIVVDDGSDDNTSEKAAECGVKVVRLVENSGKGAAVSAGLIESQGEVILLLDADLVGLSKEHIYDLIGPVLNGEADMTIGIFKDGRFTTDAAQNFTPQLNGQRCLKAEDIKLVSHLYKAGYGIEIALNKHAKDHDLKVVDVVLSNLTQVTKEEKIGPAKGVLARIKMYIEIVGSIFSRNR